MDEHQNLFEGKRFSLFGITLNFPHGPPPGFWYCLVPVILIIGLVVGPLVASEELRIRFADWIFGKKEPVVGMQIAPARKRWAQQPQVGESTPEKEKPVPVPEVSPETSTNPAIRVLPAKFEVLKELKYGGLYSGPASMTRALEKAHIRLSDDLDKFFRHRMSHVIPKGASVEVIRVTVAELGFSKAAKLEAIVESAEQRGLRPFPFDAIPAMALAFTSTGQFFFATQIAPEEYRWRAVLSAVKASAVTAPYFELLEWHDILKRKFGREETFGTQTVFLFSA